MQIHCTLYYIEAWFTWNYTVKITNSSNGKIHSHDPLYDIEPGVNILSKENAVTVRTNYVVIQQFNDIQINVKSILFIKC